eukprot:scaffold1869_cov163-Ochromonas_danica.AAC.33
MEEKEERYPAIDRVLEILKRRLGIDHEQYPQEQPQPFPALPFVSSSLSSPPSPARQNPPQPQPLPFPQPQPQPRAEDVKPGTAAQPSMKDLPLPLPLPSASLSRLAKLLADREGPLNRSRKLKSPLRPLPPPISREGELKEVREFLRRSFKQWRQFMLRRKIRQYWISQRVRALLSPALYGQTFSCSMKVQCVRRFGKDRLAKLFYRWKLKRLVLVAWLTALP